MPRQRRVPVDDRPEPEDVVDDDYRADPIVVPGVRTVTTRDDGEATTVVMPYVGSAAAQRTRRLRAWMLAAPVDLVAMLAPLFWDTTSWRGTIFAGVVTVVLFAVGGLYRGRRHLSFLDELPSVVGRVLTAAALAALIAAVRHDSATYIDSFMRTMAISVGLVIAGRALSRSAVLIARRRRWVEHSALILGGGPVAAELARLLRRYPQYGLRFTGFIDDDPEGHRLKPLMPWVGRLDDLEQLIVATETDVIIVADLAADEMRLAEIVRRPAAMRCDLWVVPRLRDFYSHSGVSDHIGAIPVAQVRRATLTGPKWALKRGFDILVAGVLLLLASPVMLLCAVAVFLEGGRGVLFRQERIGRYGRPFKLIKFRSMRPASDAESQTTWSVAHDPRVGPVGRLLRRTSLDELPQLWNVLIGDMTIVGPRPERPYFVERFSAEHPGYALRHRVPVGLTGLAQVSGLRGDTPISDRARFDNYYIENWSLWLDAKVLIRTIGTVFRGDGR